MDKIYENPLTDVIICFLGLVVLAFSCYYSYFYDKNMFILLIICSVFVIWYLGYNFFFWLCDWFNNLSKNNNPGVANIKTEESIVKTEVTDKDVEVSEHSPDLAIKEDVLEKIDHSTIPITYASFDGIIDYFDDEEEDEKEMITLSPEMEALKFFEKYCYEPYYVDRNGKVHVNVYFDELIDNPLFVIEDMLKEKNDYNQAKNDDNSDEDNEKYDCDNCDDYDEDDDNYDDDDYDEEDDDYDRDDYDLDDDYDCDRDDYDEDDDDCDRDDYDLDNDYDYDRDDYDEDEEDEEYDRDDFDDYDRDSFDLDDYDRDDYDLDDSDDYDNDSDDRDNDW